MHGTREGVWRADEFEVGARELEGLEGFGVVGVVFQATFAGRGDLGVGLRSADLSAVFDGFLSRADSIASTVLVSRGAGVVVRLPA